MNLKKLSKSRLIERLKEIDNDKTSISNSLDFANEQIEDLENDLKNAKEELDRLEDAPTFKSQIEAFKEWYKEKEWSNTLEALEYYNNMYIEKR